MDPLKCPLCSGLLRPIAVVETAAEIHAVLAPLGLILPVRCTQTGRSHDRPYAHGPPVPEGTVLVAADSLSACTAQAGGAAYPVDPPPFESRLPYPRPRDEPLRYRAEVMALGEDFDQTGIELPLAPQAPAEATGQGQLFDDDCSQPDLSACSAQADAADGEPVFWSGGAEQSGPADNFVQADAMESV
ncbi:MAG: hypothetical protein HY736_03170 [Verrucomicrobia bacterium]|nr:hypothetical protein [Verrucomicrobiota bacterium]